MGKSNTKKRFVVLIAIIALIAFIGIGYAAFSQNLNVTGSASFNSDFKVGFDNVQETAAGADLGDMVISGTNKDTVTITLTGLTPGDTYTATVDVKNTGKIDAKYVGITNGENTTPTDDVTYSFTAPANATGTTLTANSETVHTFTFTFSWAESATTAPATTFKFSYTINYEQA